MSDFADYEPDVRSVDAGPPVIVREAIPTDVRGLSVVMAARGGSAESHLDRAGRLIDMVPVLLVAEVDGRLVGWSGAQQNVIRPGHEPEWLVAGLLVIPEQRRRGIAARLLGGVVAAVGDRAAHEPIFSVINARNRASIDLHEGLGFEEVARAATFARIDFTGGEGVLLRRGSRPIASRV